VTARFDGGRVGRSAEGLTALAHLCRRAASIAGLSIAATWFAATPHAQAKSPNPGHHASSGAATAPVKASAKAAPKAREPNKPSGAGSDKLPPPRGKIAVFAFGGDAAAPLRREVVRILQAKGLKILSNIRPVDSPAQFREMADTLHVFAYVDGELELEGGQASATVQVRSGVSGLRIASATFAGDRKKAFADLSKGLWDAVAPALARASADALMPHAHASPMRIEAGTPIGTEDEAPAPAGGAPGPS
jgi:hypothetical protein